MKALVQRADRASVTVDNEIVGSINAGLCVFVGVTHTDTSAIAKRLAEKIWKLRIFDDDEGRMNRSTADVGGEILIVSQFTLYADTKKGNRPSYLEAANSAVAEPLVTEVADHLRSLGATVATGSFGAMMHVELVNNGPATFVLELE